MSEVLWVVIITGVVNIIIAVINGWQLRRVEKNTNSITERLAASKLIEGEQIGKEKEQKRVESLNIEIGKGIEQEQAKNAVIKTAVDAGVQKEIDKQKGVE